MKKMKIVAKLKPEDAEKKYFDGIDNIEIEGNFTIRNADDESALYEDYYEDEDEDDDPTPCGLRQPPKAKDWTVGDVLEAKHIVLKLMERLTLDGYSVMWTVIEAQELVACEIYGDDDRHRGHCYFWEGTFNEWVGKAMALCQASSHAYPAFVKDKRHLLMEEYDEDIFEDGEPEFSPLWEHM